MTKRFYILILCTVCCVVTSFAQRYLEYDVYKESDYKADTVVLKDCTYILDTFMEDVAIYIYNAQNHPGRDEVRWANGESIDSDLFGLSLEPIVYTETLLDRIYAITDNAFTEEQIAMIGKDYFQINLDISSSTGEVTDVYFMIFPDTYYASIPIEVFRKMELQFKDIVFELTEQGRNLTYVYLSWETTPRKRTTTQDVLDEDEDSGNNSGLKTDLGGVITNKGTIGGTIGKGTNSLGTLVGGKVAP